MVRVILPSRSKLSAELFLLDTPLDSLDIGLTADPTVKAGKGVGEGVLYRGDAAPDQRRVPESGVNDTQWLHQML